MSGKDADLPDPWFGGSVDPTGQLLEAMVWMLSAHWGVRRDGLCRKSGQLRESLRSRASAKSLAKLARSGRSSPRY